MGILILGLIAPAIGWAAPSAIETGTDPTPLNNKLIDRASEKANEATKGPLSQRGEFTGAGIKYGASIDEEVNIDHRMICAEGDTACINDYNTEHKFTRTPKKLGEQTAYNPLAGLADVTKSKAMTKQVTGLLGHPMTVANVTWMLTEPAVAGGLANTISYSQAALQNFYLSEQAFFQHAHSNPETAPMVLGFYQGCVADKLAETDGTFKGVAWIEAVSSCMGGGRIDAAREEFEEGDEKGVANFMTNPNHPSTRDKYQITVFDYLFHQLEEKNTGQEKVVVQKIKEGISKLIPDGLITIGSDESKESGVLAINIEPQPMPADSGPEYYYKEMSEANYTTLNQLMYMYCQFRNDPKVENSHLKMGEWRGKDSPGISDGYIWGDTRMTSRMDKVSVAELQMSPGLLQALYAPFEAEEQASISVGSARSCGRLEVWKDTGLGKEGNIKVIMEGSSGSASKLVSQRIRTYYYLARRLALLQLIGTYIEAERLVYKLSGGPYDTIVRNYALTQIYDAAGTRDLVGTYKRLVQETMEYLTDYFNRYENTIATSGGAAAAGFSGIASKNSAGGT